jgi:hypothetical protein
MAGANIEAIINADSNAPLKYSAFTEPPLQTNWPTMFKSILTPSSY